MIEVENKIRQKDLEEIANSEIIKEFNNRTVLISGATGLIGSEIVLSLLCANRLKNLNIKVIALIRNYEKAKEIYFNVINDKNLSFVIQDINEEIRCDFDVDYIIHTASVTASSEMIKNPSKCAFTTLNGTKNILELAKKKNVKSLCYLSSIEIYGTNTPIDVKENDYGVLDSTNIRNSYPISKKLAENLCVSYWKEYGINTKIARLTQTFGAGISENENRVFAQFAKSIVENKDIILHTDGSSAKNYCYLTDTVIGIFKILMNGKTGEAYNVANQESYISIKDLAEFLCKEYNKSKVIYDIDNTKGYANSVKIKLNSEKLELLDWEAKVDLKEMFERLINSLKEDM